MTNPLDNPYGTPFGLMDEVYGPGSAQALHDCGGPWERYGPTGCWQKAAPSWFKDVAYRRAPATQDVVPWHLIKEGWDWYARDNDDRCFVFQSKPKMKSGWFSGCDFQRINHLVGHEIGTVNWKDSLQLRPGK